MSGRNFKKPQVSMRGKPIDMDGLRAQNDEKVAIGNARMNARGDVLGRGGKIEIRRDQIIRDFYNRNPQGAAQVSLKPAVPDVFETPAQAMARMTQKASTESAPPVKVEDAGTDETPVADKKQRKLINKGD
jgi:hypothetical protein